MHTIGLFTQGIPMKTCQLLLVALIASAQTTAYAIVDNANSACTWIAESTVSQLLGGPLKQFRDGTTTIAVKKPGDIESTDECLFDSENSDREILVQVVSRDPKRSASWKSFLADFRENQDFTELKQYSVPVFTFRNREGGNGLRRRTGLVIPNNNNLYVVIFKSKNNDDPQIEKFLTYGGTFAKGFTEKLAANTRDLKSKKKIREMADGPEADSILTLVLSSMSRHYQRGDIEGNEIVSNTKVLGRAYRRTRYEVTNVNCSKTSANVDPRFSCSFVVTGELIGGVKAEALGQLGMSGRTESRHRFLAKFNLSKSGWESEDLDALIKRTGDKEIEKDLAYSKMMKEQRERDKKGCDDATAGMTEYEKANTLIPACVGVD